jgi:SulP family sulfate permease
MVIIKHLYGPLFFGFTSYFKDQIKSLPSDVEAVILRMDRVPYIDQSGLYTLEEIIFDLRAQNTEVVVVGLNEQPRDMLEAIDIIPDLVPENDLFDNIDDSFSYLKNQFKANTVSS